ncbi:MAG: ABC transporter ATP-binding protein [Desulfobacterales bacterium]|nr:ABC transporter ATP-binding protein [Desulfobacterales bacterium]
MERPNENDVLQVRSLNTFYGKARILFDMTLGLKRGEAVVLLGRNGAGKTTAFKSIMGIVPPKSGTIRFNGKEIQDLPPFKTCALGLGYVPEDRRVFSKLTILENLEVGRQPPRKDLNPWTPGRLFDLFPNLGERRLQVGGALSGGEQQMLTIARTLMGNPEAMILDEPSEGLAPVIVDQLSDTIVKLKREGVSILLAEQNLRFARRICERAYLIHQGKVCHESPLDGLDMDAYEKYCSI